MMNMILEHNTTEAILVVEDDQLLLNLLKAIFERKGYRVLTAKDGLEAVELYKKHKENVVLVLSDLGLPKLDGRETCKSLKEINPEVKVILASAYWSPKLRETLISEGAQDFIPKPYAPLDIVQKAQVALMA